MLSFKLPEDRALSTRWKLLAVAIGGAAGILGAYVAITN